MKQLWLALLLVLVQGCAAMETTKTIADEHLLGKTVSEGVALLDLHVDEYFVIDEPPGVPRGIYGKTVSGDVVELYVQRGDVPFHEYPDWKIEEFSGKRIIGIVRKKDGKTRFYGNVPIGLYP